METRHPEYHRMMRLRYRIPLLPAHNLHRPPRPAGHNGISGLFSLPYINAPSPGTRERFTSGTETNLPVRIVLMSKRTLLTFSHPGAVFIIVTTLLAGRAPAQVPVLEIVQPAERMLLVSTAGASLTGRCDTTRVSSIQILSEMLISRYVDLATKDQKENFALQVRTMFPDDFLLGRISVRGLKIGGVEVEKEFPFDRREQVDLKKFWGTGSFREILAFVYDRKILAATVVLAGWNVTRRKISSPDYRARFGNTFSLSFRVQPARSIYRVWGLDPAGTILAEDSVIVFWKNQIQGEEPPPGMEHQPFHTETREQGCRPCHALVLSETILAEKPSVETECKTCHSVLVSQASSHVPAAGWDCLLCHDPSSTPKYQMYADKPADAGMCFACHTDKQEETTSKPVVHAPVAGGECRMCHDPHGTSNPSLMVERVNAVCLSCHEEIGSVPHPVANHPVGGKPLPLDPSRELTCAGCHNPHASEYPSLVVATGMPLCQRCHKK
jgi:predicted CXXCH cytochrome family protein